MTKPEPAPFPHCNSEVLHAPRTCSACDLYPERQAMRTASRTPFTPPEANGWHGNVARYDTNVPPREPWVPRLEVGRDTPSLRSRLRALIGLR